MSDAELARAAEVVRGAGQIALACHVTPDGDALGSMLGLFHVLRGAGRDVVASFPSPFVVAPHYRELPGLDLLTKPEDFPVAPELMMTFDCGSLDRLGDLVPAARAARELVVIDHHISNDRYGTINVIEPDAAASGWVVQRLVDTLGLPLNRDAAVCLYTAIVCDTGRFQYDTTTPEVFDLARRLTEFDVPVARLSRALFEEHRFAYLQLLGQALAEAQLIHDQRFVWTAVTQVTSASEVRRRMSMRPSTSSRVTSWRASIACVTAVHTKRWSWTSASSGPRSRRRCSPATTSPSTRSRASSTSSGEPPRPR